MTKQKKQVEAEVRSWGFSHAYTWSDGPNSCKHLVYLPSLILPTYLPA